MIHEIVQIQEIDILLIDPLVLDHLKNLILVMVIVVKNSIPSDLHHVQDTVNFITIEETLDLLTVIPSENYRYCTFLRYNSRNRQYFRNYNSSY